MQLKIPILDNSPVENQKKKREHRHSSINLYYYS